MRSSTTRRLRRIVSTNSLLPHSSVPGRQRARAARIGSVALAVLVLVAGMAVSTPGVALATTTMQASCGANLRSGPSTGDSIETTIPAGTLVGVAASVGGGSWTSSCATPTSGSTWYQITDVGGQSVAAVYGLAYLYGASGLFAAASATPTPSPTPSPTPIASATPTPTPTPTPFPTPTPIPGDGSPTPSPTPTPTPIPTLGPVLEGIDVSHWQGAIDWPSVAAAGKRFAFIKASEGTTLADAEYPANRVEANSVGMFIGAYHFARPDATPGDAVAEADHFVDTARPAPGDLLPVLDLEDSGNLSSTDLQAWVAAYLGRIYERLGVHGVIYVSPNFWKNHMGDTTWFAANGYPILWVAHWTTSSAPTVPAGDWGGLGWTFWQYTSSGQVPGISGRVDLDRFNGLDLTPALMSGNPSLPTQASPTLNLVSTSLVIPYQQAATSVAQLQPLGAGRAVTLQRLGPTDQDWVSIGTLTTDAAGTATFSSTYPYNAQYRAAWIGSPDLAAATSTPIPVAVRLAVRMPAAGTTRTVARGTRITYTATARPMSPNGQQRISFLIYRRVNGSWVYRTSATVGVDSYGRATFSWRWTQSGDWYIRARANATVFNAAALSPIAVVKAR